MSTRQPNLNAFERNLSGLFGIALGCLALRRASFPLARVVSAMVGAGLSVRAATGQCAVKAAINGQRVRPETVAEPPAARFAQTSATFDDALEGSFPASDPPASRLPDEPPSNADDKWAAAKTSEPKGSGG